MTRREFAEVVAYTEIACGRPIYVPKDGETAQDSQKQAEMRIIVFFDLLGDLPADALKVAAKRLALTRKWPTFPTAAELREAATLTQQGNVAPLTAGQAWELASNAVKRIDLEIAGSAEEAMKALPPLVVRTMYAYGLAALVYGKEPLTVVRAQFERIFNGLAESQHAAALLPESVKQAVAQIGREQQAQLPAPAASAVQAIGLTPE